MLNLSLFRLHFVDSFLSVHQFVCWSCRPGTNLLQRSGVLAVELLLLEVVLSFCCSRGLCWHLLLLLAVSAASGCVFASFKIKHPLRFFCPRIHLKKSLVIIFPESSALSDVNNSQQCWQNCEQDRIPKNKEEAQNSYRGRFLPSIFLLRFWPWWLLGEFNPKPC